MFKGHTGDKRPKPYPASVGWLIEPVINEWEIGVVLFPTVWLVQGESAMARLSFNRDQCPLVMSERKCNFQQGEHHGNERV